MHSTVTSGKPAIGIVLSTTRPGRFGDKPARWFAEVASNRTDLDFELVDLRDYPLPLFGEAPSADSSDAARRWSEKLAALDGFVFITAEYNHSIPGALKNALDYGGRELHRKPAAFVGYGGVGAARAVEHLRLICTELRMAPTRTAVHINSDAYRAVAAGTARLADFEPLNRNAAALLDELAWWTHTLKTGRENAGAMLKTA